MNYLIKVYNHERELRYIIKYRVPPKTRLQSISSIPTWRLAMLYTVEKWMTNPLMQTVVRDSCDLCNVIDVKCLPKVLEHLL